MPQKIVVLALVVLLVFAGWSFMQLKTMDKRVSSMDAKIDKLVENISSESGSPEAGKKGYELTIDMWQVFEKELQDYKQRVKEGKQFYDTQQTSWNNLLTELKKNMQENDKFVTAEGEFWEKQLKSYDKLLAKTEERFDVLGQVIDQLQKAIEEVKNLQVVQETEIKAKVPEKLVNEGEKEEPVKEMQNIEQQIKGPGEYKKYPLQEEKKETEKEQKIQTIRGSITGNGEYTTY